jgi:hypothetical protein
MAINKLFIRDPSDLRMKHVNSKTVTFQRDLRILGLRSTIRVTVQKVKFFVNSGACFYFFGVTMSAQIRASVGIISLFTTTIAPTISLLQVVGSLGPLNTLIFSSKSLEIVGALNHLMLQGRESLSNCLWPWLKLWLRRTEHRSSGRRSNTGSGTTTRLMLTHQLTLALHHSSMIF